jgi:PIN domain nuclease of toxin-antitoxin system
MILIEWEGLKLSTFLIKLFNCLPIIHKDPFDRMLVAQAIVEGITLLTADSLVAQYPVAVRMV